MSTNAPSRRHLVTGLATIPLAGGFAGLAPPVVASEPDPIFALIASNRAAFERCCDLCRAESDARPAPADLRDECNQAWAEHGVMFRELMSTRPTTLAGLDALIKRFEEHIEGCLVDPDGDGLSPLLATIRSFIVREA